MIKFRFKYQAVLLIMLIMVSVISVAQSINNLDLKADKIKIGLLIPGHEDISVKHGAELAIQKANKAGGYFSKPYQLIIRSTEGPWGAGSKESVNLVYNDEVLVIMGSLDGRNAHLAEQVTAKSKIALLSTRASDMSLSHAFVPWYFRSVPNDRQQAVSFLKEISNNKERQNVAVIYANGYDSKNSFREFLKMADSIKINKPSQFLYNSSKTDINIILDKVELKNATSIVLFGDHSFAVKVISAIKKRKMTQTIYANQLAIDNKKASSPDWTIFENVILISSEHWFTDAGILFQNEYKDTYGYLPNLYAAYAYDGINIIIDIIKRAGPDSDKIIEAFSETDYKNGLTGRIQFDKNGDRTGNFGLMTIKNGYPVSLKKDN